MAKHHALPEWYQKIFARQSDEKVYVWRRNARGWDLNAKWRHPSGDFYDHDAYCAKDEAGNVLLDAEPAHGESDRILAPGITSLGLKYGKDTPSGVEVDTPRETLQHLMASLMVRQQVFIEEFLAAGPSKRDVLAGGVGAVRDIPHIYNEMDKAELQLVIADGFEFIYGTHVFAFAGDADTGGQYRVIPLSRWLAAAWLLHVPPVGGPTRTGRLGPRIGRFLNGSMVAKSSAVGAGSEDDIDRLVAAERRRRSRGDRPGPDGRRTGPSA